MNTTTIIFRENDRVRLKLGFRGGRITLMRAGFLRPDPIQDQPQREAIKYTGESYLCDSAGNYMVYEQGPSGSTVFFAKGHELELA